MYYYVKKGTQKIKKTWINSNYWRNWNISKNWNKSKINIINDNTIFGHGTIYKGTFKQ